MLEFMKKITFSLIGAIGLVAMVGCSLLLRQRIASPVVSRDISAEIVNPEEPANSPYLVNHRNVLTTWFRGGTPAGDGDRGTSNIDSAWYKDWRTQLGSADNGRLALVRPGKDNLYYFALPCPDYNDAGLISANIEKARSAGILLPTSIAKGQSAFKNLWIQVKYGDKTVYAQWEDVGPLGPNVADDCPYVLGDARPLQEKTKSIDSALDLSPTAFTYLNNNLDKGVIKASWAFVAAESVPDGPWKATITTAGPDW